MSQHDDYGTAELHKREFIQLNNGLARNYKQLPLDDLRYRSVISERQWQAGDRLNYLFVASRLNTYRSPNFSEERGTSLAPDGELSGSERAEIEYKQATRGLRPDIRQLTIDVCCHHMKPILKHILPLRDGLDQLISIFKIKQ